MSLELEEQQEVLRLLDLADAEIIGSSAELEFDSLARLAAITLKVPCLIIGFIDDQAVWPKAFASCDNSVMPKSPIGTWRVPLHKAVCQGLFAVSSDAITMLLPATDSFESLASAEELCFAEEGFKVFAGAKIFSENGRVLGAVCALDREERVFDSQQMSILRSFAKHVESLITKRRELKCISRKLKLMHELHAADEMIFFILGSLAPFSANGLLADAVKDVRGFGLKLDGKYPVLGQVFGALRQGDKEQFLSLLRAAKAGRKVSWEFDVHPSFLPNQQGASVCLVRLTFQPEIDNLGSVVGLWLRAQFFAQKPLSTAETTLEKALLHQKNPAPAILAEPAQIRESCDFSLLQHVLLPVAVLNDELEIVYANQPFGDLFMGLSARFKDLLLSHLEADKSAGKVYEGKTIPDYLFQKFNSVNLRLLMGDRAAEGTGPTPASGSSPGQAPLSSHIMQVNLAPFNKQGSSWIMCTVEEMSKVVEAEEKLEFERARLVHHAKLATLGEMAGGIAHEINNPLTIIRGKVDILKILIESNRFEKERFLKDLNFVEGTVERIGKIIRGLKNFVRQSDSDPKENTKISILFEDVLAFCQDRFLHDTVELKVYYAKDIEFLCRSAQIAQILVNLLSNSLDAVRVLEEKWVNLSAEEKDSQLYITVTDSGKGIAPEVAKQIMNPFFTTKKFQKGNGLGLSISQDIAKQHNGALEYNDKSPNTQFVLKLPLK